MKKLLGIGFCLMLSGCGLTKGGIVLIGSPEGIRAFADGQNALISNSKTTDPLGDSAAWQHRKQQEQEVTKREYKGFFGELTK